MRQLHLLHAAGDELARDVVAHQLAAGDEVRVVLMDESVSDGVGVVPNGALAMTMPPLQYDELVEHVAWSERVVSW